MAPKTVPNNHDTVYTSFSKPSASSRPTPLFWWSGADLDKDRLEYELDLLAQQGIGGTVVGYSHLPNGRLDHGDPEPMSDAWWSLFSWFVDSSTQRNMTVGFQDYGIIGPVLRGVGASTTGLHAGTLRNEHARVTGPRIYQVNLGESEVLSTRGWNAQESSDASISTTPRLDGQLLVWQIPEGTWDLSIVLRDEGLIGTERTTFDPLHPLSGAGVINSFYELFASHLGGRLGTAFITFFQDELDLGLVMPMWNDMVAAELAEVHKFDSSKWVHGLWHDLGSQTFEFRAAYRDTVVGLLERHYFRPIYEWHEQHGTQLVMDQLSRGDLRLGEKHYGDFMDTMRWYHGPGNDDPDLTGPRNIVAFAISASLAHLNDRPLVMNEAFHSSGWGITPTEMLAGANVGFACGANQLIIHGLNYTTEGGWWEWASPDFHFRQPWWRHSRPMWEYFARVSEVLRMGHAVSDVAVLDPTQDVALSGADTESPEIGHAIVESLILAGLSVDVVPSSYFGEALVVGGNLTTGSCSYRAVVVPTIGAIRQDVLDKLHLFVAGGGTVLVCGTPPWTTEIGPTSQKDFEGWHLVQGHVDIATALKETITTDFLAENDGLIYTHRSFGDFELYFIVNSHAEGFDGSVRVRTMGRAEWWDAWNGSVRVAAFSNDDLSTTVNLTLEPGCSAILCVRTDQPVPSEVGDSPIAIRALSGPQSSVELAGPWTATIEPTLDNRFGDFGDDTRPLGVETWHLETAKDSAGPWIPSRVEETTQFLVLGPVAETDAAEVEAILCSLDPSTPAAPLTVGGHFLAWRPYPFSVKTGLERDPLLLDRSTGPHGLKEVPDEFIDPSVLDADPPAGSHYFFVSRILPTSEHSTIAVGGRCQYRLLVNGNLVAENATETPAAFYRPWGLRDLSVTTHQVELNTGLTPVCLIMSVVVSGTQPTRAFAVAAADRFPDRHRRSRLRWWDGPHSAYPFEPVERTDGPTWVRVTAPPGAYEMSIAASGPVTDVISSPNTIEAPVRLEVSNGEFDTARQAFGLQRDEENGHRIIRFAVGSPQDVRGDGTLTGPIRWKTSTAKTTSTSWAELGLTDFSGVVRFSTEFDGTEFFGSNTRLVIEGLEGTAKIWLNGADIGTVLEQPWEVELTSSIRSGVNILEIEVANSLINYYSRWPSPFSVMQSPNGGFSRASLLITRP